MPTENRITEQPDEVKRYRFKGAAGEYVYAGDFDNATRCFLDANERCVAAERREQALHLRLNAADQRIDELTAAGADRSPKDYAIEHAEFMATSADDVLAKFQAYGLALMAVDEGGDDGAGELFENIDSARGDLQESLVDLRGMVYEFRKRCHRQ